MAGAFSDHTEEEVTGNGTAAGGNATVPKCVLEPDFVAPSKKDFRDLDNGDLHYAASLMLCAPKAGLVSFSFMAVENNPRVPIGGSCKAGAKPATCFEATALLIEHGLAERIITEGNQGQPGCASQGP